MNFVTATRFTLPKPKWIIANFVETTQAATDNVLKTYDRVKNPKKTEEKKLLIEGTSTSWSDSSLATTTTATSQVAAKAQRDVFGATILPSNLSFDNMKKLSMNQIKLEDIPLVDDQSGTSIAEVLATEKLPKLKDSDKKIASELEVLLESGPDAGAKSRKDLDFSKMDPFDGIPGPKLLPNLTSTLVNTARQVTVYFLLQLLRRGSVGPLRKYGPIVRLPEIMGGKILLVNRADYILSIYEQDKRRPVSSCLEAIECSRLRRHRKRLSGGETEAARDWDEVKRKIDDALLKDEEKYFDSLEESCNSLVRTIRALKNRENEVPADFVNEINKWSLECLFQILFDRSPGFFDQEKMKWPSKNAQLLLALQEATRGLESCDNSFQLWRLMKTSSATSLDTYCCKIETILSGFLYDVQAGQTGKEDEPKTFIERMLMQSGMTSNDVVTHLLDAFLIGMNSMTNALAFLLYHLASNPREQTEVYKELKRVLPEKYSRLEHDHLASLPYLRACLKESLRLNMPMPILLRVLNRDVIISNFQVPRGTFVLMSAQMEALKNENFESACEFRPKRWLDPETKHGHMVTFASLPLSSHPQSEFECRLAETSVLICAAQIIRNFVIEYNHGKLTATNSTISYPTSPLSFCFLERDV